MSKQTEIMNYWVIPGIKEEVFDLNKFKDELISLIEKQTKIPLTTKTRIRDVCEGRQLACFILRKHDLSLQKIGDMFNIDHATVLHSIKAVNNLIEYDKYYVERWLDVIKFAKIVVKPSIFNKIELSNKIRSGIPLTCGECNAYDLKNRYCYLRDIRAYDNKPLGNECLKYNIGKR